MSGRNRVEAMTLSQQDWQRTYEEIGPAVLAYLVSRTGNRHDAEDLLQETFVRVIRRGGRLQDEAKLKAYLFSTAHNLMVNAARKRRPQPLEGAGDGGENPLEQVADGESLAADDRAQHKDLLDEVQAQLVGMQDRHRTAFRYAVLEGRPYREIARLTGWTLAQVKINVHRARRQMIEGLGEKGFLDQDRERKR